MVKNKVKNTILKYHMLEKGDHVIIGLSGGPDSVCLFFVLKQLSSELDITLHAVHVNHKFRPGAAEEDQAYVEELCKRQAIPCRTFVYDCNAMMKEQKMTGEEAGRAARYEAFSRYGEELAQKGIPREQIKIAVAQNADDQAETVLMRLMRGTGPDGLAGISHIRMEGGFLVVRPLLDVWRKEIAAFCEGYGLRPRIDHTNLQPIYTRNKIRLELIPYLEEYFNPNIMEAMVRLSSIAGQDKDFLWDCADKAYHASRTDGESLSLEKLREMHPAIRQRVIVKAFEAAGLTQDITAAHLFAAERLLDSEEGTKTLDFPKGYAMEIQYGQVRCLRKKQQPDRLPSVKLGVQLTKAPLEEYQPGTAVFDWDKICAVHGREAQVCLRRRQAGDYIRLRQGRKKLQDFFVDQKVPRELRDQVPLAAVGSEILWVISCSGRFLKKDRYNEKYKLDETTKKALLLEILCDM